MIISCNNCHKKFDINSDLIPQNGRLLECSSCNHQWFFKKEVVVPTLRDSINNNKIEIFQNDSTLAEQESKNLEVEIKKKDKKPSEPIRARTDAGHFVADDPSTPDVNEAYVGGKTPAKKKTVKKTTKK